MSWAKPNGDFTALSDENRRIWNVNAEWWDDRIGDGNDFQVALIEPVTERLLNPRRGDTILDVACGAGRFARRMAELGAQVVAIDQSERFIARARKRSVGQTVEYVLMDAGDERVLLGLGANRFNKAVCTMALMDMSRIEPLFRALSRILMPGGSFVFTVMHPCFGSGEAQRFAEMGEDETGRLRLRNGIKISTYLGPKARKTEGIVGQPEPQYYFHRPLSVLLGAGFAAGLVVDALEESAFPHLEAQKPGMRWDDMPEIPPVLAVRMRNPAGA